MLKNWKTIIYMFVGLLAFFPIITFAKSITNYNGIIISEEEYANFIQVHSHEYIMTMDESQYEKLLSLDYSNIIKETKYIETTYNSSLNLTTEREMTEEEYENYIKPNNETSGGEKSLPSGSSSYETGAKKITLILVGGTTYNYVTFTATWKGIPVTRSYDVIGFRGYGFNFRNGSQIGRQIYKDSSGTYHTINYAWNGTNIKKFSNGFGISMNIVNSTITELQLIIDADVSPTITHPDIFASYQHAVTNLSLADSQNYTLSGAGLGSVFSYPYNISTKYDGMSGVSLSY